MSEKRYRIAGSDSDLARSYPDVAKTLSISGRNMSNICYGCMALFIRCLGFCPQSREEVKEMSALIKTMNDHNVRPWMIISSGDLPIGADMSVTNGFPSAEDPDIGWSNPDMEEELY